MTLKSIPPPRPAAAEGSGKAWARALARRVHFYAAVLVGPFLLIAALSGALYALTPQLEKAIYANELTAAPGTPAVPVAAQVEAAQAHLGTGKMPAAVRPGTDGTTTRVMFSDPSLGESETRAIFVDPGTAAVKGDLNAYGTSGSLPVHTWIGQLHRNLHLGETGRVYSELAASWLWVIALGGLILWVQRWKRKPRAKGNLYPGRKTKGRSRTVSLHASAGIWLAAGFFFLSATGLTWSSFAGANVTDLRAAIGWSTPALTTDLNTGTPGTDTGHVEHTDHAQHTAAEHAEFVAGQQATARSDGFDAALAAARADGIDAEKIEIKPPATDGKTWTVTEIDRSWPTQVDAVALDPGTMIVSDKVLFEDYPVAAKLARWGIDAHMGVLFGLPNQLILAAVALGLAAMIVWGYTMWIERRPTLNRPGKPAHFGRAPKRGALKGTPPAAAIAVAVATALVGYFLPLLGISFLGFLLIDSAAGYLHRRKTLAANEV